MAKYFKKINLANIITDESGKPVSFRSTNDGNGVIELDEAAAAPTLNLLDGFADQRIMGIVRISKEIYDELLKKKASMTSRRSSVLNRIRAAKAPDPFGKNRSPAAVAEAAGKPPEPDLKPELPPDFQQFRNRTRKLVAEQKAVEA